MGVVGRGRAPVVSGQADVVPDEVIDWPQGNHVPEERRVMVGSLKY